MASIARISTTIVSQQSGTAHARSQRASQPTPAVFGKVLHDVTAKFGSSQNDKRRSVVVKMCPTSLGEALSVLSEFSDRADDLHNVDKPEELAMELEEREARMPAGLKQAVTSGDLDTVRSMMADCDASCTDEEGNTPLHVAVEAGNVEMVTLVAGMTSDINTFNAHGRTALDIAIPFAIQQKLKAMGGQRSQVTA